MSTSSENPFKSKSGLKRILKASQYSLQGIQSAFKHEAAFRQELMLCIVLAPLAFVLGESAVETLFLITTLFLILIIELINSAIETLADRITHDLDELIGRAKDMASASIFFCLTLVTITWVYFVIKRFFL